MAKDKWKSRQQYGCMMCPFTCYDTVAQTKHFIEKHAKKRPEVKEGEAPYPCEYCGEGFRTPEGRDHHYETKHQGVLELKT